ncbi:MAG: hypothetical protein LBI05_05515 [Planctomycetaceae bacterium]|jgi:hypothetical protein|nr:hypothetical protein [Planctomycetaceae bacterium]
MMAFQLQTVVPNNGELFLVVPADMRGKVVEVCLTTKADAVENEKLTEESVLALRCLRGMLKGNIDLSDLRDEKDREI